MILVLTYHRIVPASSSANGFFDVGADELGLQLQCVKQTWGLGASPENLIRPQKSTRRRTNGVIVTFDDGTEDHYTTAAPVLEHHGMRGVFFVSTNRLNKEGYLSVNQCRELQARGHWIESHSHDHKRLSEFPPAELTRQLSESRRILRDLDLGQWGFIAVPGGDFNFAIQSAARDAGYALLRTLEWGYNRNISPFRIQSVTVNRRTSGCWFRPLTSPQFEWAKKGVYRAKELFKSGGLGRIYFRLRDAKRR